MTSVKMIAVLGLGLIGLCGLLNAAEPAARYQISPDFKKYPQDSPQTALASIIKAGEARDIRYILAHLADPEWVDQRVKDYGNKFDVLVKEAAGKLVDDATAIKTLKKFASDGNWKIDQSTAQVKLKDLPDRTVQFKKINERWYLENEYELSRSK